MSYQSEKELEEELIQQLIKQGYSRIRINNEDDLKKNLREELNKFNKEKLRDVPLTDKEFNRILIYLEGKSVYERHIRS